MIDDTTNTRLFNFYSIYLLSIYYLFIKRYITATNGIQRKTKKGIKLDKKNDMPNEMKHKGYVLFNSH